VVYTSPKQGGGLRGQQKEAPGGKRVAIKKPTIVFSDPRCLPNPSVTRHKIQIKFVELNWSILSFSEIFFTEVSWLAMLASLVMLLTLMFLLPRLLFLTPLWPMLFLPLALLEPPLLSWSLLFLASLLLLLFLLVLTSLKSLLWLESLHPVCCWCIQIF
jgi:hypothetical protein